MKEKAFQIGMWLLVLFGASCSVAIIIFFNPYVEVESLEENLAVIGAFYFFLSLFFDGLFSLFIYWLRKKAVSEEEVQCINKGVSFRQGFLLSFALILVLILQSFRVLVWWDALLAIGAVSMIELYFLAR